MKLILVNAWLSHYHLHDLLILWPLHICIIMCLWLMKCFNFPNFGEVSHCRQLLMSSENETSLFRQALKSHEVWMASTEIARKRSWTSQGFYDRVLSCNKLQRSMRNCSKEVQQFPVRRGWIETRWGAGNISQYRLFCLWVQPWIVFSQRKTSLKIEKQQ